MGLAYFSPSECEVAHTSRGGGQKTPTGPRRPSRARWRVIPGPMAEAVTAERLAIAGSGGPFSGGGALLRSKGEILGEVEAPDVAAAKAAAAVQFDLDEIQRNRIMVQELA
jgi:hypothetical protein